MELPLQWLSLQGQHPLSGVCRTRVASSLCPGSPPASHTVLRLIPELLHRTSAFSTRKDLPGLCLHTCSEIRYIRSSLSQFWRINMCPGLGQIWGENLWMGQSLNPNLKNLSNFKTWVFVQILFPCSVWSFLNFWVLCFNSIAFLCGFKLHYSSEIYHGNMTEILGMNFLQPVLTGLNYVLWHCSCGWIRNFFSS